MQRLLTLALCLLAAACPKAPATCTDGVRNGQESDVDCGGPQCGRCVEARACFTHDDCETGLCRLHLCAVPKVVTPCDGGPACAPQVECRHNTDCASGACLDGLCVAACPAPLLACGPACVDSRNDPAHCGGCGVACTPNQRCEDGGCEVRCPPGTMLCPVDPGYGCVDTQVDVLHCGDCTTVCQPGQRCVGGSCQLSCAPFQVACNGQCVSTMTDVQHCGGCDAPCDAGQVCAMGACQLGCTSPLLECDGGTRCVDLRFDPRNCGGCGVICPPVPNAGPLCLGMSCGRTLCNPGFEDCNGLPGDGCETNLVSDALNCGSCGRACGGPCVNGMCP